MLLAAGRHVRLWGKLAGPEAHRARFAQIFELQDKVGERNSRGDAAPYDDFGVLPPTGEADDHPDFEEDERARKAARHPLTVLLYLALANEPERHARGEHP